MVTISIIILFIINNLLLYNFTSLLLELYSLISSYRLCTFYTL